MITKLDYRHTQGFWEAIYSSTALSDAIEYITGQFDPEDIFDQERLKAWALDNGFVEEPK